MVVLTDIRSEFYHDLLGKRVLVMVVPDVDGLCAWRILKELFIYRQILYTLVVVPDKKELLESYNVHRDSFEDVILLNCGANFDIIEALEPPQSSIFYVCDSHRPIHVNNFYNQRQVKLLCLNEDTSDVPKFEDVFQQFSSDDESMGESDKEDGRVGSEAIEKRVEKRRWLRRRQDILMDYESFSFFAVSSSIVLFDLAWRLSQENNCLLWYAIVGQTSQLLTHSINREHYIDQLDYLQSHVSRLGHAVQTHSATSVVEESKAKVEIALEDDLALWLYKHWSLKETMETSMLTASRFKLFTEGGQKRLLEFLVHIGLPRREYLQRYSTMSSTMKENLNGLLIQHGEKYGLSRRDLFVPSFTVQLGYRTPISALDAVLLTISALEHYMDANPGENFQHALDTLACWSCSSLDAEITRAQLHLAGLASQVRNLLDTDEVVAFGPFLYVYIRRTSLVTVALCNPLSLAILARYLLMAKAAVRPKLGRERRVAQMPLIVCVDSRTEESNITLVGIPPLHGDDDRNLFGQAFEAAVRKTKARAEFRYFSSNFARIFTEGQTIQEHQPLIRTHTMAMEKVARWKTEIRVLDGGFGSECEKRSRFPIDGHKAWSCRLLKEDPNLVCEIHKSFLRAGCDVISTNTYQASPHTLADAMGISVTEAKELIRHAVRLARRAVDAVIKEEGQVASPSSRKLPILIAGSLGSYGACLADGSEYSGDYGERVTIEELVEFHQARAEILLEAGVDLLAWETIPLLSEVAAICEVMRRLPDAVGWISVMSLDGQTTVGGDPLHDVALEADKCERIFGIGVNCSIPHHLIHQALHNLSGIYEPCEPGTEEGFHPPPCDKRPGGHRTDSSAAMASRRKILLLYANSGEQWVSVKGRSSRFRGYWIWPPKTGPNLWARVMSRFAMRRPRPNASPDEPAASDSGHQSSQAQRARAQWVGGCCRVGPEQLTQLAEWMKPDEIHHLHPVAEEAKRFVVDPPTTCRRSTRLQGAVTVRRKATITNCGDQHIKRFRRGFNRKTL